MTKSGNNIIFTARWINIICFDHRTPRSSKFGVRRPLTCPEAIHVTSYKNSISIGLSDKFLYRSRLREMIINFLTCLLSVYGSSVDIVDGEFRLNNEKIFLSGANQAWHWFGFDFGNGNWWKDPSRYDRLFLSLIRMNKIINPKTLNLIQ